MITDFKDVGVGSEAPASCLEPVASGARIESPSGTGGLSPRRWTPPPPDPELVALVVRAQAGDLGAQTELVRRYRTRVSGFVRPLVPFRSEVEDLVQTVWVKMVQRIGSLREPARFETWLFTLARNTVRDYLRRSRCRPVAVADETALHEQPDSMSRQYCQELMEAVDLALRDCRARERRVLRQLIAGASYQTIAVSENVSLSTLKVRVHRLRVFLRVRVREVTGDSIPGAGALGR